MVGDQHQVAGVHLGGQPTGGVGDDEGLDADPGRGPHAGDHVVLWHALVEVDAALLDQDGHPRERPRQQPPLVTGHRGPR